jgi:hypothetical protein
MRATATPQEHNEKIPLGSLVVMDRKLFKGKPRMSPHMIPEKTFLPLLEQLERSLG